MKVRFVCTKKQDSATVHRRLVQANHTRNYQNRQKARKDNITANHQGELISDAVSLVVGSELLEPEKDSLSDTEEIEENGIPAYNNFTISIQEVDDSTFSTIGPDPYYEEEIVNIYSAEEREDQR
ncbi:hypothetical protein FOTG_17135 [Fusarium oxysporum f. sp. vasinfectum 25433]|uniref:Uncharacterized protein n=1 Tax=Fusarium oxysporum f. sp. vasinfectum 25433 TaxID=1089449 RepID=X0L0L8_FUSOX|nr:hypothetical protein FOTG_17135 [Fusarium oxysporum f. sp. vasinfectum 25433]